MVVPRRIRHSVLGTPTSHVAVTLRVTPDGRFPDTGLVVETQYEKVTWPKPMLTKGSVGLSNTQY
jgi:hypothetical protein